LSAGFGWVLAQVFALEPATLVLGLHRVALRRCASRRRPPAGVPLVTAFHVTRVVVLLLCTAPLFARVRTWRERKRGERR